MRVERHPPVGRGRDEVLRRLDRTIVELSACVRGPTGAEADDACAEGDEAPELVRQGATEPA